jgi:GTP cyclohydrolase I
MRKVAHDKALMAMSQEINTSDDPELCCIGRGVEGDGTALLASLASGLAPILESQVDLPRIERAVREILLAVGEDPDREGLRETPARVSRMYAEMFAGLKVDPRVHLTKVFSEKYDEVVLVRDISFCSMCEHHLLPFIGTAHVAYIPDGKVVGLSKLARVVEVVSRRPQVQERMTQDIARLIEEELRPKGVAVVIEASHSCMTIRGIRKPGSSMVTSAMTGLFRNNVSTRAEVMQLIYGKRA